MIKGWSCWECGSTWKLARKGVWFKIIDGNDPDCEHEIHAVPEAEFLAGVVA